MTVPGCTLTKKRFQPDSFFLFVVSRQREQNPADRKQKSICRNRQRQRGGQSETGREDQLKYQTDQLVFLTFKCHVYIKKCFLGILITIVNSQGDVKWIHGALGWREGQKEEAVRDKYRWDIYTMVCYWYQCQCHKNRDYYLFKCYVSNCYYSATSLNLLYYQSKIQVC